MSNTLKRKANDEYLPVAKHAKADVSSEPTRPLLHFSHDIEMKDVEMMDVDLSPSSSTDSSPVGTPTPTLTSYPNLEIYAPIPPPDTHALLFSPPTNLVQLFQPTDSHNRFCNCSQIPRLKLACPTPNGNRTMWTCCNQCGAVSIVANQ